MADSKIARRELLSIFKLFQLYFVCRVTGERESNYAERKIERGIVGWEDSETGKKGDEDSERGGLIKAEE